MTPAVGDYISEMSSNNRQPIVNKSQRTDASLCAVMRSDIYEVFFAADDLILSLCQSHTDQLLSGVRRVTDAARLDSINQISKEKSALRRDLSKL